LLSSLLHLYEEVTKLHHEPPLFTTSVVLHLAQVSGSSYLRGFELIRKKEVQKSL